MGDKKIVRRIHQTRVRYQYCILESGKTGEHVTYLNSWLSNETFIKHQLEDDKIKVFNILSIEHVSVLYTMHPAEFIETATATAVQIIKKLK